MWYAKNLNPCPKCGGSPRITMYIENVSSETVEIQCTKCGLTLYFESERAWTPGGAHTTLGANATWSYRDWENKSSIEAWNNAH